MFKGAHLPSGNLARPPLLTSEIDSSQLTPHDGAVLTDDAHAPTLVWSARIFHTTVEYREYEIIGADLCLVIRKIRPRWPSNRVLAFASQGPDLWYCLQCLLMFVKSVNTQMPLRCCDGLQVPIPSKIHYVCGPGRRLHETDVFMLVSDEILESFDVVPLSDHGSSYDRSLKIALMKLRI
ncbi:hypothetical protein AVEN_113972-1 [Araneus ventricosus]|uniref:Uncharacterized protein n=1 Tax=Araneus ventricosus TaxID=182803 RepID=A0A4Y2MPY8_ARAVE|nr:hypothetical protein AVEN_113972-1 [Araneus ventricosus]